MLFDKILSKVSEMKVAGRMLRDAVVFRIDTASLANEDRKMLTLEMARLANHIYHAMSEVKKMKGYPDGRPKVYRSKPGEGGSINFPNAIPPYKNMVVQTRILPGKPIGCYWILTNEKGFSFIPLCDNYELRDWDQMSWLSEDIDPDDDSRDYNYPTSAFIKVDYYLNNGTLDFNETYIKELDGTVLPYSPEKKVIALVDLSAIYKIFSIINCANIEYVVNKPDEKLQRKRAKKNKLPLKDYYTLVIKRKRQYHAYDKVQGQGANDTRLHMCRGHFKTYTPERPLFGRYTGTYWWQEQMRGNAALGEIEKDYAVEA